MRAIRVRVTGRVQGVGFRWHTALRAREASAAGWVRNEPDGSVTAHVEGTEDAVRSMLDWLNRGPAGARVDEVSVADAPVAGLTEFQIRR